MSSAILKVFLVSIILNPKIIILYNFTVRQAIGRSPNYVNTIKTLMFLFHYVY